MNDPTDIKEQERKRDAADLKASLKRETEEADLQWLMKDPRGRRIVWRMLATAGVFRSSFSTDAVLMAFNEGARNTGLTLMADLMRLSPAEYFLMTNEAKHDAADRTA